MRKNKINQDKAMIQKGKRRFIRPRLTKKAKMPDDPSVIETDVPRITNETVEQHRKEVIKGGKKYRYPLIHTPKRIIGLSMLVGLVIVLMFSTFTVYRLYRSNVYSDFYYNVTKIVPMPIARVGGSFVYYDDYLFELRRYVHYFESQQNVDFSSEAGQASLREQQKRSIDKVIEDVYIAKLARQKNISVSNDEVDAEIALLREQNKLGSDEEAFEEVLLDFWGWTINDYRQYVRKELLKQKVTEAYDDQAWTRAREVEQKLEAGADFADLAAEYSDDLASAANGGEYGFDLNLEENNEDPQVLEAVFGLKKGQVSEVINTGYRLEIVKVLDVQEDRRTAAHISIFFTDISDRINDLKEEQPAKIYISLD
ncbi:peptidylprolyl isomerase [Candidatus Saccharibacteria bacterium]|nr:peptidylprolyl isomerase [Candidatus Saccharibacteria bacterium]MCB9821245.1 peptidylprolyl isomerase [Candidatus Nomurabacteria bacterium]